ncbi:oxidoreductase [Paractinoplanes ferrugineus]|uniref:Short-chain dehydrogenase/reductase n=1 Tax=Paractinoplanes ferrugineus TaxID=113564 RepID=A0A919J329_9ACTN|nr:oxidoreductase [Actinoplanes ferrugineus]GIE12764.1 putative short-chain dehydrogenase/reductase [Actinoplanes ferrugineus]
MITLPDLTGRTVVITGASSGIGLATAHAFGAAHARVVLAVRDTAKGTAAAASIPGETDVRHLDLADLDSVRRFADRWSDPIHILVNNAGVSSPTRQQTRDGFELQFGTNHLGPFALTNLLLPHVTGRVVALSSQAERTGRINFDDLNFERTPYQESRAYAAAKLANLLFITELQRRLTEAGSPVLAAAAHPGLVATPMTTGSGGTLTRLIVRHLAQSPAQGALPVLFAATADIPPGSFTGPEHAMHMRGGAELIGRSKHSKNPELARRLWTVSEDLTGIKFGL